MMRVLVVDDNLEICEFMKDLLEQNRCFVVTAESGEEGLEAVEKMEIDLAFLDISLPGMDGVETMVRLQKSHPETRFFLMSGVHLEDRVAEGIRFGAERFFRKPFSIEEILEIIKSVP